MLHARVPVETLLAGDRIYTYSARRREPTERRIERRLIIEGTVSLWLAGGIHQRIPIGTMVDVPVR